ncbi:hypothetical protein NPIL_547411 [Nephila pilipes]|uniref:Uncharacterized protein n=1 Tax=Nephila pilipes TaxID=299642 RepID=A0A8X6K0G9_NEPPI|nr:hypothetical protein NPIL_547411 [Nephila pilipes]
MKKSLGGQLFTDDEELKTAVTHWFKSQTAAFYAEGIGKTVRQANMQECVESPGHYFSQQKIGLDELLRFILSRLVPLVTAKRRHLRDLHPQNLITRISVVAASKNA